MKSWMTRFTRAALFMATLAAGTAAWGAGATYTDIEQKTGWSSCSVCAGTGGAGSSAPHTKSQTSSPSRDGHSAKFHLGGSTPYSNALWWKQLGHNDSAANFKYDLYYYIKNPSASQALEFDVNQSRYNKKFIFGTECDFKNKKAWKVYDAYNRKWMTTSIPCRVPTAYKWHHVVLEFKRTSTGKMQFLTVTINGTKAYFNRSYAPHSTSAREINVAFQMDGNKYQTDYDVWLDDVKLVYW
jgi:hypothetical protein